MKKATNTLTPHPRNTEFFNDIVGEPWQEFLKSVETSGVIEPVVITPDGLIVSGHQRVRACLELGIPEVPVVVREYADEDAVLKDLLETNLRQRGVDNSNPVKLGRCIRELERLYGIEHGGNRGNQYTDGVPKPQNAVLPKSQEDLARELKMSTDKLQRYKKLADLIPELEDLIDTGMISPTTALALSRQLSQDDQLRLLEALDEDTHYSSAQLQPYIDEIKRLQAEAQRPKRPDYSAIIESTPDCTLKELELQDALRESEQKRIEAENVAIRARRDKESALQREEIAQADAYNRGEENVVLREKYQKLQRELQAAEEREKEAQEREQKKQSLIEELQGKLDNRKAAQEYYTDSFEARDEDFREVLACCKDMQRALERFAALRFKRCMTNPSTRAGVEVIMRDLLENYDTWVNEIRAIFNTQDTEIIDM